MAYSNNSEYVQLNFFAKVTVKIGKWLAKSFPLNSVRRKGLRLCGFTVGQQVYVGEDLIIASMISERSCNLEIGDRVAIGPRVTLVLSSDANWSRLMEYIPHVKGTIKLGNDCWLGAGVIILPNVTIGEGAIVGSGAVVTKDVEPYTVVAGVPAKLIRKVIK